MPSWFNSILLGPSYTKPSRVILNNFGVLYNDLSPPYVHSKDTSSYSARADPMLSHNAINMIGMVRIDEITSVHQIN